MIFDEIPFELKQHLFTYVKPDEWITTVKVSKEWLKLTLGSINRIEACHALMLDHLAEFINQQENTKYTWLSLVAKMPNLEHLECEEAFVKEMNPMCQQLKNLSCTPQEVECFDWNKLDRTCNNFVDLLWEGADEGGGQAFAPNWFAYLPKLEKLTLRGVQINAEWRNKIPKSVKHIFLHTVEFCNISIDDLCEDSTALESFSAVSSFITINAASQFFDKTPHLKKLKLQYINTKENTSMILENALRKCSALEIVTAYDLVITTSWQKLIPENIKSVDFSQVEVLPDIRTSFSFDWLFQNYGCLQTLQFKPYTWAECDPQKFHSSKTLKKLVLGNDFDATIDPYSEICVRMVRGSHLVDIEIYEPVIDESWFHIFPATIKRLKLKEFQLSKQVFKVFSPQFICENPSNIEFLSLSNYCSLELPAMGLNAFHGMNKLKTLLFESFTSGECLQSILKHCTVLTDLVLQELHDDVLTEIPQNLVLPSLFKLGVKVSVDQLSLLLEHFPNARNFDFTIVPLHASFSDIMQAMQVVETVEIKIRDLTWPLLRSLVESIDDIKFRYFCLSRTPFEGFRFYFTNSLTNAFCKLRNVSIFEWDDVLWIKNYPTSPLLRKRGLEIPSSMDDLFQRYCKIKALDDDDD